MTINLNNEDSLQLGLRTILMLQQQGQIPKAIETAHQLLVSFPQNFELLHGLGALYLHINHPEKGLEYLQEAIKVQPDFALSYNFTGVAYCQIGEIELAIEHYKKALELQPNLKEALFNLGVVLVQKNNLAEAEFYFKQALTANFTSPVVFYNLGYIEHQKKNLPEAIAYYQKALALASNYTKCAVNLGEAYFELGNYEEANKIFSNLVYQLSQDKNVHKKLGATHFKLGNYKKALLHLKKGFDPEEEDGYVYLSMIYSQLQGYLKQYEILLQGIKKFPFSTYMLMTAINLSCRYSIWKDTDSLMNQFKQTMINEDYFFYEPFYYVLGLDLSEELLFAKKIAKFYTSRVAALKPFCQFDFKTQAKSTIKIGYISGNVRNHPNAHMIMQLFTHHNRKGFEYFLYATNQPDNSIYAQTLIETVDHFIELATYTPEQAAWKIYQDGIDILVDLSGYFNQLSSDILALKPASIIVGFLDHCGTRGADYIDYIFTDNTITKKGELEFYQEKLIFLPNTLFITHDKQIISPKKTRQEYAIPEDRFVLTCINNNYKYDSQTFVSWMKILSKLPDSVLVLWTTDNFSKLNLKNYARDLGVDPSRLYFQKTLDKSEHISRLQLFDLFIDCFRCSAHSTALDALLADLPMVSLYGKNVAQRGASSILKAYGMPELIAYSIQEYEEKIIELATNPEQLDAIKTKMQANKTREPLFNTKLFASHLETAYQTIFDQYVAGKKPEHILIN